MENFIFYTSGKSNLKLNKYQVVLFYLLKLPILQKFIKPFLKKTLKLPITTSINSNFSINAPWLQVGENVSLADTYFVAWAPIIIGENTTFSYKNCVINSTHDTNNFSTVIGKPIIIGNNTWITSNCTILGGVRIGDNTIIGAGSVVVNDIPSGVFAAGNPCKVIRTINFKIN
jgi:maltose O-acetyltransferase